MQRYEMVVVEQIGPGKGDCCVSVAPTPKPDGMWVRYEDVLAYQRFHILMEGDEPDPPLHVVDALELVFCDMDLDVDPERMKALRALCDERVPALPRPYVVTKMTWPTDKPGEAVTEADRVFGRTLNYGQMCEAINAMRSWKFPTQPDRLFVDVGELKMALHWKCDETPSFADAQQ